MAHTDFCFWCWTEVSLPETYDSQKQRLFCSALCMLANWLFEQHFSNKAILDREFIKELKEAGDGQSED